MTLPANLEVWELRAKRGRKHVVMYRAFVPDGHHWAYFPTDRINGPVRWYMRRRGQKFTPMGDWMAYW